MSDTRCVYASLIGDVHRHGRAYRLRDPFGLDSLLAVQSQIARIKVHDVVVL
jgi:hypothetical protein